MAWLDQVLNFFGFAVCHGLPTRSLALGGEYLPVCARCAGLYLGIAATYVFLIARRGFRVNSLPPLRVSLAIVGLLLPMAFDGLTSYAGLRETTNPLRFGTGLAAGAALPIFAFPLLSPELVVGAGKAKPVRPFGAPWEYAAWLGGVAALGGAVYVAPGWLYYPVVLVLVAGLVGIFFNLSLVIWEMVLERAGRWGRRPFTFIPAALSILLVFSALNGLHFLAFRAMLRATGGELPP
jgi:uncharacterized membrane protein